jgi:uncharacterized protein (TIGR02646 family)
MSNPKKTVRKHIKSFAGKTCVYCDAKLTAHNRTIDHAVPKSRIQAGINHYDNLLPACFDCNQKKGSQTMSEFLHIAQMEKERFKLCLDSVRRDYARRLMSYESFILKRDYDLAKYKYWQTIYRNLTNRNRKLSTAWAYEVSIQSDIIPYSSDK